MTVVNTMEFDGGVGMVTDSQLSSHHHRKYDVGEKIKILNFPRNSVLSLIGQTGDMAFLNSCLLRLEKELNNNQKYNIEDISKKLANMMIEVRRESISAYLQNKFGINESQALTGEINNNNQVLKIHPELYSKIKFEVSGEYNEIREMDGSFVVAGKDGDKINIYLLDSGKLPKYIIKPYITVGSGRDISDIHLANFIQQTERKKRMKLGLVECMSELISATNRSIDHNSGVGGIPSICYINGSNLVNIEENKCILSTEVIRARDADLINYKRATKAIEDLLCSDLDIETIERTAFKNKYQQINKFLRGYK